MPISSLSDWHGPFLRYIHKGQLEQLEHSFIIGKRTPVFCHLSQRHVKRLDCVGCVNNLSYLYRVCKIMDDPQPVVPPRLAYLRMGGIPLIAEGFQIPQLVQQSVRYRHSLDRQPSLSAVSRKRSSDCGAPSGRCKVGPEPGDKQPQ